MFPLKAPPPCGGAFMPKIMKAIIGTKIGMSQIYGEDGRVLPVTLIQAGPMTVTQVKTKDRDGYDAVQVGAGERKAKNVSKPVAGHLKLADDQKTTHARLKEFRVEGAEAEEGKTFDVSVFEKGDLVDVRGTSKGKGFQGVVKRYNFRGGPASHGGKHNLRQPGAIGSAWPQRVLKGTRMAGRMGAETVTVRNLLVAHVDPEENILALKGAVPGPKGSWVEILANGKKKTV